jgi:broad specificity phosphatase PhoE
MPVPPVARQTAAIIAERLGLQIVVLPALAEVAVAAPVLEAWTVCGALDARAAEGDTGHAVAARSTAALAEIAAAGAGHPAIVVGHVASLTTAIGPT